MQLYHKKFKFGQHIPGSALTYAHLSTMEKFMEFLQDIKTDTAALGADKKLQ